EAQAIGLVELSLVDQQLDVTARVRDAIDAAEVEVAAALLPDPVVPATVVGIAEIDAAVAAADDDVVGAIEVAAAVVEGEQLAHPARAEAHQAAGHRLAD